MLDARRHVICTLSHVVRSLVLYAEILRSLANQELVLLSYCRCDRPHLIEGYLSTDPYSADIGRLTVNSLPRRRPALAAVTLPPWHSTRLRIRASPIPRPRS